ncbi:copine-3-like isoform X3 [Pomacea canaliculata]|uniref:copine-3-like isoform X3 n=1 Tax=Pomacea canaliculata TaxID=400727 RepID=UPI000D72C3F9|nr:copine-3-like isoform X3 [Pomacea canaliculata]
MVIAAAQTSLFKLRPLRRKPKVSAEEIKEGDENVLTFRGKALDKMDFFGKSDPYLEILRSTPGGSWQLVHRTEVVKNNLNPSWKPFELSVNTLCGRNKKQIMKFDVYDWDSDGSHDYIGGFSAPLEDMLQAQQHELHLWWICWAAQAEWTSTLTRSQRCIEWGDSSKANRDR